jgi:hypothetical protein
MLIDNLGASTSHASNFERRTLFVKYVKVEKVKSNIACLDKGKTSGMNICVKRDVVFLKHKYINNKYHLL